MAKPTRGRPHFQIDKKQFENLCQLQCTQEEIAGFFGCTVLTLGKWCKREYKMTFGEVFAQKRVGGLISLRRNQFRIAQKNAVMAIWLGKQYLNQTDEQKITQEIMPIVINDNVPMED